MENNSLRFKHQAPHSFAGFYSKSQLFLDEVAFLRKVLSTIKYYENREMCKTLDSMLPSITCVGHILFQQLQENISHSTSTLYCAYQCLRIHLRGRERLDNE